MLRSVMTLLVVCVAGAVVGVQLGGGFALTLVALAGILVLGATAVSLTLRPAVDRAEEAEEADVPGAEVRYLAAARTPSAQPSHGAGEQWRRVA